MDARNPARIETAFATQVRNMNQAYFSKIVDILDIVDTHDVDIVDMCELTACGVTP